MSESEFQAAGLDKLSPEELAALNAWLRDRAGAAVAAPVDTGPAAAAVPEDRRGFDVPQGPKDPIVSRITGEFRGWDGAGVEIALDNGQVWKTTDQVSRLAVKLSNPVVVITPGMFNAWFLKVEGYSSRVRVERVR